MYGRRRLTAKRIGRKSYFRGNCSFRKSSDRHTAFLLTFKKKRGGKKWKICKSCLADRDWGLGRGISSIFVVCILQQRHSLHEHAAPNQELRVYCNKSKCVCKKKPYKNVGCEGTKPPAQEQHLAAINSRRLDLNSRQTTYFPPVLPKI